ncbi:EVE domain-containing protein [Geitlerinema splendidum]|nr:EVE domain-containing protein [Geitlerinema splendidum]
MAYWLLKSEPSTYTYADLERDRQTVWDGVNNALALKHLRAMNPGDLTLIYHSGKEKQVVGIAEVVSSPYADPKLDDPKRVVVDLKPARSLQQPVTLAQMKQSDRFEGFDLLRLPRLSVMPVPEAYWSAILELAKPGLA